MDDRPIEIATGHRCVLGDLTDRVASLAGIEPGDALARRVSAELERLVAAPSFARCCEPAYLAHVPRRFPREIHLPVARRERGVETRVILWPVGAADAPHPHASGWSVIVPVRGDLVAIETRSGRALAPRRVRRGVAEIIVPEDGVVHRMRNGGDAVAMSVHVFGPC